MKNVDELSKQADFDVHRKDKLTIMLEHYGLLNKTINMSDVFALLDGTYKPTGNDVRAERTTDMFYLDK